MIKLLKRIADWLDARFPPKLTVTVEKFDELLRRQYVESKNATYQSQQFEERIGELSERIESLEKSMTAIKELLAKGGKAIAQAEKMRDEFIRGEFGRGLPRVEVKSAP